MDIKLRIEKLNNRQDPIALGRIKDFRDPAIRTLVLAENVDIDRNGVATRRKGRLRRYDGAPHSFWVHPQDNGLAFFVEDQTLMILNADFTSDPLSPLNSNLPMAYEVVNGEAVGTNQVDIGWINNAGFAPFAPALGQFEAFMPPGQYLAFANGILYVASGPVVFASKPYNVERRDTRYSEFPMNGYIRMMAAVEDGIWAATERRVFFISGGGSDVFTYLDVTDHVPPDGAFWVGWERVGDAIRRAVVWVSTEGFCMGLAGGKFELLSTDVALPTGSSGRVFSRTINGIPQYIAVINNPEGSEAYTAPT